MIVYNDHHYQHLELGGQEMYDIKGMMMMMITIHDFQFKTTHEHEQWEKKLLVSLHNYFTIFWS